jgi:hypothetical protein
MRQAARLAAALPVLVGLALASPALASPVLPADTGGVVSDAAISPQLVQGGQSVQGTVTLVAAVGTSTSVALSSTDTSVLTVPASVTVPAGSTTATFTVTTFTFTGPGEFACVLATAGGGSAEPCLDVNPVPSGPTAVSVSVSPVTVGGGGGATGTVRLSARADINTTVVSLTSSNPAVASVPAVVPPVQGSLTTPFPITTFPVASTTTVAITATVGGVSRSGTLTVTPGTPVTDTVRITRAEDKKGLLRIEAASTNPNAILSWYVGDDSADAERMTNEGGGRYQVQHEEVFKPEQVTVVSNFGGMDTANVS